MITDSEKHKSCPNATQIWFKYGNGTRITHGVACIYSPQFNLRGVHPFTAEYVKETPEIGLCEDCARELGLIW